MTEPPPNCRDCEFAHYPKKGRYISIQKDGEIIEGRWRHTRKYKPNPCHPENCNIPAQYADWIASIFLLPPTRPEHVYTVGSNIMDRSVREQIDSQ